MRLSNSLPFFQATAVLTGTIIGAGIFGLPFIFAKAGFLTGVVMLAIITAAMLLIKLMLGEVALRTHGRHQISGYVAKYLGGFWKSFTSLILIITISGALLAYFVGIGQVLAEILSIPPLLLGLIFYAFAAAALFFGIQLIKVVEFFLSLSVCVIVFIILLISAKHLSLSGGWFVFDLSKIFLPYGIILFACVGEVAIPEMRHVLLRREKFLWPAIFSGVFFSSIVYLIFTWIVLSVTTGQPSEIATIGLGQILGAGALIVCNVFAFFTMSTSFLTNGLALKNIYHYDLKTKHFFAWLLTLLVPLIFYFFGLRDFVKILGIFGAFGFSLNGLVYIATYFQARKKGERQPEYALSPKVILPASLFLILIFLGGLAYTIGGLF